MRAALKVLNDSLKKTSATLLPRVQLKQAIDVVREEWFKVFFFVLFSYSVQLNKNIEEYVYAFQVTSSSDCSDHHVKNYVNWFTSYSPVLLEFIINMTDAAVNMCYVHFIKYIKCI